jgi:hypothetical protein
LQVLCASTADGVEPLAVPEGATNGERVFVEDYAGEPEVQLNPKKKILESLLPDMATDASAPSSCWLDFVQDHIGLGRPSDTLSHGNLLIFRPRDSFLRRYFS